jgi:hypothetical protein
MQPFNFDLDSAKKKHQESPSRYQRPIEVNDNNEKPQNLIPK